MKIGLLGSNRALTDNEYLRWKLCLLDRIGAFGENDCAKGATGVETGLLWKLSVLKGLKAKIGHCG